MAQILQCTVPNVILDGKKHINDPLCINGLITFRKGFRTVNIGENEFKKYPTIEFRMSDFKTYLWIFENDTTRDTNYTNVMNS